MLKDAIESNPFKNSHFCWINFCIERMGFKNLIHLQEGLALNRDKFSTVYIDYIPQSLVQNTLVGLGIDCIDLGLSTTPTVEIAVTNENASGGIIITASHNPKNWNALKLLNNQGEFLSSNDGDEIS